MIEIEVHNQSLVSFQLVRRSDDEMFDTITESKDAYKLWIMVVWPSCILENHFTI